MTVVYVLNKYGNPLMPCSARKARLLLKCGRAAVKKRTPFTIQLTHGSSGYKQPVVLGVDAGSKTVGLSASTEEKELFAAELKPRCDIVKNLSDRREFRRTRRNRKTRYRAPRFDNRVHSKNKGWLAPSVEVKIQEHITSVKRILSILPVSAIVAETAEFDTQRLKALEEGKPLPEGIDYQLGEMYDQYNVRQYVLHRDGYRCRCCGIRSTEKKPVKFHVHHLENRKVGSESPRNKITLCEDCHTGYHNGLITDKQLFTKKPRSMRDAAFMGIMRKTLIQRLKKELSIPICETFGYVTKYTREKYHLDKSHTIDALCIANHPKASRIDKIHLIKPVRHHNRQLHKATVLNGGIRKNNQALKYVKGFRLFDKVLFDKKECFVWGRRTSGSFLLRTLDGKKVKDGVNYKYLNLLERSTNYLMS